jgi:diaminopimelate epimerase
MGLCDRKAQVLLPGGVVEVEWNQQSGHVFLSGPAEEIFRGKMLVDR